VFYTANKINALGTPFKDFSDWVSAESAAGNIVAQ